MLPDDIAGGAGALRVKFFSCHDPSIRAVVLLARKHRDPRMELAGESGFLRSVGQEQVEKPVVALLALKIGIGATIGELPASAIGLTRCHGCVAALYLGVGVGNGHRGEQEPAHGECCNHHGFHLVEPFNPWLLVGLKQPLGGAGVAQV